MSDLEHELRKDRDPLSLLALCDLLEEQGARSEDLATARQQARVAIAILSVLAARSWPMFGETVSIPNCSYPVAVARCGRTIRFRFWTPLVTPAPIRGHEFVFMRVHLRSFLIDDSLDSVSRSSWRYLRRKFHAIAARYPISAKEIT